MRIPSTILGSFIAVGLTRPERELRPTFLLLQPVNDEQDTRAVVTRTSFSVPAAASSFLLVVAASTATAIDLPVQDLSLLDPRYFVAGGLCAAVSHGIATPIDVIKTRIQASKSKGSFLQEALEILKQDDKKQLLAGLAPTLVGYGIEGAAKFGLYESLKPIFRDLLHTQEEALPFLLASVVAGAAAALLLCPLEQVRIKSVTDPVFGEKNLFDAILTIANEEGIGGLFGGLFAMVCKQVPYTAAKQVSFDEIATFLYSFAASFGLLQQDTAVKAEVQVAAAFLASVLACIASHPGDVILTATYKSNDFKLPSFGEAVSQIYREEGLRGFISGITARFLHVGIIITSQLVLYDDIKQALGLPATGTH